MPEVIYHSIYQATYTSEKFGEHKLQKWLNVQVIVFFLEEEPKFLHDRNQLALLVADCSRNNLVERLKNEVDETSRQATF